MPQADANAGIGPLVLLHTYLLILFTILNGAAIVCRDVRGFFRMLEKIMNALLSQVDFEIVSGSESERESPASLSHRALFLRSA